MTESKDDDLLKEIRDRFREAYDAMDQEYSDAISDLEFANGDQWPSTIKADRESEQRPCLVINKIPTFADQVIGDIRQNEPSIKVKPIDSVADPQTAEILTGLIRNIEVQNDAEIAYDTAAESAIYCGYGAFRIGTDYTDDDQFDQDIIIERIKNPFTVYWDPSAQKWNKEDARYCFVTEKIPREEFKRLYPDASTGEFQAGKDKDPQWGTDKTIRIAEYWKKEPIKKTIYLMQSQDGNLYVTEVSPDMNRLAPMGWQVLKDRKVESHKIVWWKATHGEILDGPTDWPGKYIPIIGVYGKELNIEGKTIFRGIVRNSKDPQRLYNYSRSTGAEKISLAPKSPYLVTAKMISNYQGKWDTANKKNWPYLPYDVDPGNPTGMPQRVEPIIADTGIISEIQISDQEIHDTTGLQLASLGKKSNEKSGRAILARQREGDVANYAYYDNLGRALRHAGKILVDLIPKIYDTARIIRIINPDNTDETVPINQPFENREGVQQIYDLTVGKYDVVVSIGPSYTTQRDEAAENMMRFIEAMPQAAPLIADLLVKNLDWPGAAQIEKRLKLLLPPQLQGEADIPQPPPAPPDPMQIITMKGAAAEVQGKELENKKLFYEAQRSERGEPEPKAEGKKTGKGGEK